MTPSSSNFPAAGPDAGLRCDWLRVASPGGQPQGALAVVQYGRHMLAPCLAEGAVRLGIPFGSGLPQEFAELWRQSGKVDCGAWRGIHYAHGPELLFAAIHVPGAARLAAAVRAAYTDLFGLLRDLGFDQPLRFWTFIAGINDINPDGLENYQDFCIGRAEAIDACRSGRLPAATVVGCDGDGIHLLVVARRRGSLTHLDNPLQVAPDLYPPQYGPRAPQFARATLARTPAGAVLFVSGTAAILGHETVNAGDVLGQTHVAIDNVQRLIDEANFSRHGLSGGLTLQDLAQAKVYVRHVADHAAVLQACRRRVGEAVALQMVPSAICRADLLVELECLAWLHA